MSKADDWKTRLHHEASLHERTSFLTLTYSDEWLPDDYSVHVRDLQLFMKRLRHHLEPAKVRFFGCGEYGDQNLRPHYHLLLFGYDFPDKQVWRRTQSGHLTYRSAVLESLWTQGNAEIGLFSPESAGYVARYVLKKINGDRAPEHYTRTHPLTGQVSRVQPEFIVCSRRPGIGAGWFQRYASDCFPSDFVVVDGSKKPVPTYYKRKLGEVAQVNITKERKTRAKAHSDNNTPERLAVREELQQRKVTMLRRDLED